MTSESREPIDEQVEAYALGTLNADQRQAFEARLAASASLQQRVRAARAVMWLLAESPPELEPSGRVRANLLAAVQAEGAVIPAPTAPATARPVAPGPAPTATRAAPTPLTRTAPTPLTRPSARRPWATWLAAAALLVAVGMGAWNTQLHQQLQQQLRQRERDEAALQTLIAADRFWTMRGLPDRAPDAYSTLALNLRHRQTVLAVTGFPVLPPGQTYQVWVVQAGRQVPVGTFSPANSREEQTLVIPSDLRGVTHAMITVEPASGSPQPSGPVVMDGDL